jgi:hypothetical protein
MKTAVLISGQMRTADQCAAGIRDIYPDATFVVHAVADDDAEKAFLFRPAVTVIEPQYEMPERREYSVQIGRGCHGVQRVLKQLWGLRLAGLRGERHRSGRDRAVPARHRVQRAA